MKRTPYPIARPRNAAMLLLPVLLAGCTLLGPDYVKPEAKIPDQWSRTLQANAQPQDLSAWWAQLNDPLLTELVNTALQANLDLHAAQARLQESRARRDLAGGNRFPTLTGGLSGSRNRASGNTSQLFDAGFDASWEPDVFGGLGRALEASARLTGKEPPLTYRLARDFVDRYAWVSSAKAERELGYTHRPARSTLLRSVKWYVQRGYLEPHLLRRLRLDLATG